jgi:hypothetical protein
MRHATASPWNPPAPIALMIGLESRMASMADDTKETENVQFIAGQVHALVGFCVAVINSHPSPEMLGLHLEAVEHVTLAHVESTLVMEDFLEGTRNVFDRLKAAVADAEARQEERTASAETTSGEPERDEGADARAVEQRQGHP